MMGSGRSSSSSWAGLASGCAASTGLRSGMPKRWRRRSPDGPRYPREARAGIRIGSGWESKELPKLRMEQIRKWNRLGGHEAAPAGHDQITWPDVRHAAVMQTGLQKVAGPFLTIARHVAASQGADVL